MPPDYAIIDESLRLRGIRDRVSARTLVERARRQAAMNDDEALSLAVSETRAARKR